MIDTNLLWSRAINPINGRIHKEPTVLGCRSTWTCTKGLRRTRSPRRGQDTGGDWSQRRRNQSPTRSRSPKRRSAPITRMKADLAESSKDESASMGLSGLRRAPNEHIIRPLAQDYARRTFWKLSNLRPGMRVSTRPSQDRSHFTPLLCPTPLFFEYILHSLRHQGDAAEQEHTSVT